MPILCLDQICSSALHLRMRQGVEAKADELRNYVLSSFDGADMDVEEVQEDLMSPKHLMLMPTLSMTLTLTLSVTYYQLGCSANP